MYSYWSRSDLETAHSGDELLTSGLQMVYLTVTVIKQSPEPSLQIVASKCQLCDLGESFNSVFIWLVRVSMRRAEWMY